ncbi:hypothetical protein PG913_08735 [Tenacibaculum pacificus]|nr:hypothetical protein [Tenacibaculum pacificus]WBX72849.1 hypothetical protein PG913_08015 [Tenacibaculum pacificus]WBX72980.1 hypothetical protein PG913_08735 [Tenacibaculum pacificus]
MNEITINYKNSSKERLFDKILTPANFENIDFEQLIKMKSLLKTFNPNDEKVKLLLKTRLELVQKALNALK